MTIVFTDAVEWLIRNSIRKALGWDPNTVRKANQEYPRGSASDEFATVLVHSAGPRGQLEIVQEQIIDPDTEIVDATHLRQNVDSIVDLVVSVQFFKSSTKVDAQGLPHQTNRAFDFALRLPQLMVHPEVRIQLDKYGLALRGSGTPQNLTGLLNGTQWESRGLVELHFSVVNRESFVLATYNVVRLGLLSASPGGEAINTPIEVTT